MQKTLEGKVGKSKMLIGVAISLWMLILNIAVNLLELHGWPMFFVTIFFFMTGAQNSKIPQIFLGGLFGLLLAFLFHRSVYLLAPYLGSEIALYLPLGVVLFCVILGEHICPQLCNGFAFGYFTIACNHFSDISAGSIVGQILMLLIGGGIALGGSLLIKNGLRKALRK